MMYSFRPVIFLFFFSALVFPVQAEVIQNFRAEYQIRQDGTVKVKEQISYQFTSPRHGIYRKIPLIKTNKDGQKYKLELVDVAVNHSFSQSTQNNTLTLKIGDPNKKITGLKEYIIEYTLKGALTYFSDHDEFYWNVTGNDWEVSILAAQAKVFLPAKQKVTRTDCFTGKAGSTEKFCQEQVSSEETVFSTNSSLSMSQGLTIVAGFPKGLVAELKAAPYQPFWQTSFGQFLSVILKICFLLAIVFWYLVFPIWIVVKWYKSGRDPRGTIGQASAWFSPPKVGSSELSPAEVGTLVDEKVSFVEFSATIVDLARRGYLRIKEEAKNSFSLIMQDKADKSSLREYEKELLDNLFAKNKTLKIEGANLYTPYSQLVKQLYQRVVELGLFAKNPNSIRLIYGIVAALALSTLNILLFLAAVIFGLAMPKKTVTGVNAANQAEALKKFLTSQKRQLEFQADKQLLFEKLLPYAIVFGVEKVWAKRFAEAKLQPPDWYESQAGSQFSSVALANGLSRSFGNMSRAATATTSSSGFSSGFSGGSSGGGGGGGGGGSW